MITAERVRRCRTAADFLSLFRDLGYPVEPVDVDPGEWRRGGVAVPRGLKLMARLPRLDVFLLDRAANADAIASFLREYASYNVLTKSMIVNHAHQLYRG